MHTHTSYWVRASRCTSDGIPSVRAVDALEALEAALAAGDFDQEMEDLAEVMVLDDEVLYELLEVEGTSEELGEEELRWGGISGEAWTCFRFPVWGECRGAVSNQGRQCYDDDVKGLRYVLCIGKGRS
jgi:hypothetical protein